MADSQVFHYVDSSLIFQIKKTNMSRDMRKPVFRVSNQTVQSPCLYVKYFTLLISKMYLMRVLSFIGDVRFNVRGEHVPGCLGRG